MATALADTTPLLASQVPSLPGCGADRAIRTCPHCQEDRVQRWGGFAGRQRYRCTDCERTFSTFTGTPLHYLKRIDRWPAFCHAMETSLTVREAALAVHIHKDTAFLWRHRLLRALAARDKRELHGRTVIAQTCFPYSRKGARAPATEERAPHVWCLLAHDRHGSGHCAITGRWHRRSGVLAEALEGHVASDVILVGGQGSISPLAMAARRLELGYSRFDRSSDPPSGLESPGQQTFRLKQWMRRFRGVATRYLLHYLVWFLVLDAGPAPLRPTPS